jgi:hypothetical protein
VESTPPVFGRRLQLAEHFVGRMGAAASMFEALFGFVDEVDPVVVPLW